MRWKILVFWISIGLFLWAGFKLKGYEFVHSRGAVACLSCMGLEE
ncbi:hypothetical protein [Thermodesulfobacterium sp. TA1]|nr:hypothetical protein [Thermodesulfobacterium sp. TA1]